MTIALALAESVEDIDDLAVQALQGLWDNDFIPIAFGVLIFLISAGVSTLQTGVPPRWMGYRAGARRDRLHTAGLPPPWRRTL